MAVDARLPADDASVAKAAALYEPAVDAFWGWCADDQHELKPGMQVTSTYARDTKVRRTTGHLGDYYGELVRQGRGRTSRPATPGRSTARTSGARARGISGKLLFSLPALGHAVTVSTKILTSGLVPRTGHSCLWPACQCARWHSTLQ